MIWGGKGGSQGCVRLVVGAAYRGIQPGQETGDPKKARQTLGSRTCPVQSPTTRSAMNVSSVSPERWLTITPQPLD